MVHGPLRMLSIRQVCYGKKIIVLSNLTKINLHTYLAYLRLALIEDYHLDDACRYIFPSFRGVIGPMGAKPDSSMICKAFTTLFKKSEVFADGSRSENISPSRIRASVATELAGLGEVNLSEMATCFMKHNPETSSKFYIKHWSNP